MPIYKMDGRKDGKQKYRVRINYIDRTGKSKQIDRVVYGSEEAKMLEMKLSKDIKETPPDQRMTIQELYDEYMAVKKGEIRETTYDKTRRRFEHHILPELGATRLDKFDLKSAQKWKLSVEGLKLPNGESLKLCTKRDIFKSLSALFNYAQGMEYIAQNPLKKVGNIKEVSAIPSDIDYYTAAEYKSFMDAAHKCAVDAESKGNIREWEYYVFFSIAFYTGLRKGEIHALRWDDINGSYLSVKRSIAQKLKGEDRETPPKNAASVRTIQIPAPLLLVLNEHRVRCASIEGFSDRNKICGGILPLRDTTIQNRNKQYSEAAGIKTIRIHDFRHSHASLLANEGINIQEIARRLGHSNVEITWNTYSHLYPREEERAIEILNKIV